MAKQKEIFITSDLFFSDEKIRKEFREQFKTCKEMNKYIISNWNKKVKKNDIVWILGDVGTIEGCKNVKRLNGNKKLIIGDDDALKFSDEHGKLDLEKATIFFKKSGFKEVYFYPVFFNDNVLLSHEPCKVDQKYMINVHGHLHKFSMNLKGYYNVSLDFNKMSPIKIDKFVNIGLQKRSVRKEYGKEWYSELYN